MMMVTQVVDQKRPSDNGFVSSNINSSLRINNYGSDEKRIRTDRNEGATTISTKEKKDKIGEGVAKRQSCNSWSHLMGSTGNRTTKFELYISQMISETRIQYKNFILHSADDVFIAGAQCSIPSYDGSDREDGGGGQAVQRKKPWSMSRAGVSHIRDSSKQRC
ncbi:hypothetical protein Cni_G10003 [Canna indica]|uniref:Uncharacterized protein n=1 Tax=Canna indica TaxID=4628 RepID=A0AAQ3K3M8_9LILI|nr:hypothetical protein Cni_G10003 [Canna indica]